MSVEKKIFILRSITGQEKKVVEALENFIASEEGLSERFGKIIVPTEEVAEFRAGEKRVVKKKHFPGYVFVEMEENDELFLRVSGLNVNGIKGFVKATKDQSPQAVTPQEAKRLLGEGEKSTLAKVKADQFVVGQNIKVKDGPFKDFTGTVEEVNSEKQKIKVSVLIFGRSTPVELDFFQVEIN